MISRAIWEKKYALVIFSKTLNVHLFLWNLTFSLVHVLSTTFLNQLHFSAVLVTDLREVRKTIARKTVKQLMAAQLQRTYSRGFG